MPVKKSQSLGVIPAKMIAVYYGRECDSKELFLGYKIAENKEFRKHLNKYNVIHLDIADIWLTRFSAMNEYTIIDEMPTGKGYADIVFLPKPSSGKLALVIELKYDKSAKGAINQIKNKKYIKKLEAYKGNILLIGINYAKNSDDKNIFASLKRYKFKNFRR